MNSNVSPEFFTCPVSPSAPDRILLGHGGGGRLTSDLIQQMFLPAWNNPIVSALEDQATLDIPFESTTASRLAFTTDAFVVKPLFFPGGDIGKLAVNGTVNDLAVGGAIPAFLAAAFILEEGMPMADLRRIIASMSQACAEANVQLVTGDTKVVDRGKGDQLFITTTGIGWVPAGRCLSIHHAQPGDSILVSGTLGDHGVAILSVREGIEFETALKSDTAALTPLIDVLLTTCPRIRCLRDPTRGGVAGALNELATASQVGVKLQEARLPVRREVAAACEMLGLDPLYIANEGKLLAVVPPDDAEIVLAAMRRHPLGQNAAEIATVVADHPGTVVLKSVIGGERVIPLLTAEQLPRIC